MVDLVYLAVVAGTVLIFVFLFGVIIHSEWEIHKSEVAQRARERLDI